MRQPAVISFLAGMTIGLSVPTALYSVEIAQVMAGVVTFRPDLPMGIHHGRVFSLVVDAAALLLHAGLSEDIVCRLLTALMAGLSFLTMSVVAHAFTGSRVAAYAAPFVIPFLTFEAAGHKYPHYYPRHFSDLGINGFHLALLTLSLLATRVRAGVFMLGLMPGLHASLAVAVWLITGAGLLFDRQKARQVIAEWRWFAGALGLIALAWLGHQYFAPGFPSGPIDADPRFARGIMATVDVHRAPIGAANLWQLLSQMKIDVVFLFLGVAALAGSALPPNTRFWVGGQLVMTLIAIGVTAGDEFYPGWAPLPVAGLMMSRWLNLNYIVVPALAASWGIQMARPYIAPWVKQLDLRRAVPIGLAAIVIVVSAEASMRGSFDLLPNNRRLYALARSRSGVILAAYDSAESLQLATRRALLFDTRLLDTVPYAPAAGPAVERILNDVYGVSTLSPELPSELEHEQQVWESFDLDHWRRIRQTFDVTDVVFPAHWHVALPRLITDDTLAMAALPE